MKPSEIKQFIKVCFLAGIQRPIHLEGSPGLGKTEVPGQVAAELGVGYMKIHAPLLQPEDYAFPVVSADKSNVRFIVSADKFPLENSECPEKGIFLIDEIPQCDSSSQKILAQLLQEREIHGQRIKPGWLIVTTGNRTTDRAGANRLLSHLSNKITRIDFEASLDDWTTWALNNGIKLEVISYLRLFPEFLSAFNPQNEVNATPRSWCQGVSARLGVIPESMEFQVFKGDVGEGPAAQFCSHLKLFREIPNPDHIMVDPMNAAVPENASIQYALVGALAYRTTPVNFGRILTYINRIPNQEFSVLFIKIATKCRAPKDGKPCMNCDACKVTHTKEYIAWAIGPGTKLLS